MFDETLYSQKLRELIRVLYAMPANSVRPANQNAPTGTAPFAVVGLVTWEPIGTPVENLKDIAANNVETFKQQMCLLTYSVQFYRDDALAKAISLETALQSQLAADFLRANGMSFVSTSAARNLTALVDTTWEPRAQVDVELYGIVNDVRQLATYGTFPLETTVDNTTVNSEVNDQ